MSKDFFISYNGRDRNWAEWIAWILEKNNYTVTIQAWDFLAGGNFILEMQQAATECAQTIAVLSDNYLNAVYTQPEWAAAFVQDPQGKNRTLIPIRVDKCEPKGILTAIIYIDIVGLMEDEAETKILAGVSKERGKPKQRPLFPGNGNRVTSAQVAYPGEVKKNS